MLTQGDIVGKWLEFTLADLRDNVRRLRIQNTGHLLSSIEGWLVTAAGGDVGKLGIAYALYGQFADMGVGRGMGAGVRKSNSDYARIRDERGQLHKHTRKQRQWYSKEMGKQSVRLGVLLSDYYGETTIARIQDALPGAVTINL